ncbi:MAG: hypothetical protein HY930_02460 [Euryarchaeota archaeon]|nr:hypothetical protein [Euryarchaeota archaeon]
MKNRDRKYLGFILIILGAYQLYIFLALLFGWTIVLIPFRMTAKAKSVEVIIENPEVELLFTKFFIAFIFILLGIELATKRFSKLIEKYIKSKYGR